MRHTYYLPTRPPGTALVLALILYSPRNMQNILIFDDPTLHLVDANLLKSNTTPARKSQPARGGGPGHERALAARSYESP
ncbi:hypothetical protein EVAR_68693_1 [Eumeta japonica]|uniref:Uncharacterized protein n=1 Tax=Eumeta variegata TaxID=151549 RepID=A0A4C2A181_EUMVA|nr:hypothetical protein EVAR_68693_1 [Eumeta japonica]